MAQRKRSYASLHAALKHAAEVEEDNDELPPRRRPVKRSKVDEVSESEDNKSSSSSEKEEEEDYAPPSEEDESSSDSSPQADEKRPANRKGRDAHITKSYLSSRRRACENSLLFATALRRYASLIRKIRTPRKRMLYNILTRKLSQQLRPLDAVASAVDIYYTIALFHDSFPRSKYAYCSKAWIIEFMYRNDPFPAFLSEPGKPRKPQISIAGALMLFLLAPTPTTDKPHLVEASAKVAKEITTNPVLLPNVPQLQPYWNEWLQLYHNPETPRFEFRGTPKYEEFSTPLLEKLQTHPSPGLALSIASATYQAARAGRNSADDDEVLQNVQLSCIQHIQENFKEEMKKHPTLLQRLFLTQPLTAPEVADEAVVWTATNEVQAWYDSLDYTRLATKIRKGSTDPRTSATEPQYPASYFFLDDGES